MGDQREDVGNATDAGSITLLASTDGDPRFDEASVECLWGSLGHRDVDSSKIIAAPCHPSCKDAGPFARSRSYRAILLGHGMLTRMESEMWMGYYVESFS